MSRINPSVRGFAIILLIAGVIVLLNFQTALSSLLVIARIAFFIAIAFFLYLLWRDRRDEIGTWGTRSQAVFYGAVGLAIANLAASFWTYPAGGLETIVFIGVFVACGYALWRTWRREHTYSY